MDTPSVEVKFTDVAWRPLGFHHFGRLPLLFCEGFQVALI